ncbi:hypothetical protein ANTPLA_LOCUS1051 [Anthophora plagiata]
MKEGGGMGNDRDGFTAQLTNVTEKETISAERRFKFNANTRRTWEFVFLLRTGTKCAREGETGSRGLCFEHVFKPVPNGRGRRRRRLLAA